MDAFFILVYAAGRRCRAAPLPRKVDPCFADSRFTVEENAA